MDDFCRYVLFRSMIRVHGTWYLRRTMIIRTCDQHKNLYVTLFLPTSFGNSINNHVNTLSGLDLIVVQKRWERKT